MPQSTIQYVLSRLRQLGVTDIFGVPGDFAFPINDAICEDKNLRFIGVQRDQRGLFSRRLRPRQGAGGDQHDLWLRRTQRA